MGFHPGVIALFSSSVLVAAMILYSAYYGYLIVRHWDVSSGSEMQLALERRTYLISTILTHAFAFQLLSLFLFVFTADQIHSLFVGAMCAAGTLNVNEYGYPALVFKAFNFLLAGIWLIINYVDNRGYDYPLTRKKYALLLALAPFALAEAVLMASFFLQLDPNVITSCCGSLFGTGSDSIGSDLASLPARPMIALFWGSGAIYLISGLLFIKRGKGATLFGLIALGTLVVSMLSVISFVSLYFYELPTHHCPFCILQGEYRYVGYPLYAALFGGAVAGTGVGVLQFFRHTASLREFIPLAQKRLAWFALGAYTTFLALVTFGILSSNLVL